MQKNILFVLENLFNPPDKPTANQIIWHYVFGIILLACCGCKLYYGLQSTIDIQFADEAAYMRFGLNLFEQLNRDWGPMYAIWYKCLSLITTDTIQLYYINYVVASILISLMLYIFLLRISVHHVFALLISFSVLVSELNVSVWPRISHFCIVLCLATLIFTTFLKKNIYKFLVFTLLCLIASYARPEFYLSFILLTVSTIICIFFNRRSIDKKDILIIVGALVLTGILHSVFWFPSNDFFGYNRGVAAFYQHYAWNLKWRSHATFDAWLNWEDIAKQQFGNCNSMWCVIKTQPMIVFKNTLFNVRNYIVSIFANSFSYVFPLGIFHGKKLKLIFYLLLFVLTITSFIRKQSRASFFEKVHSFRFYLLILFLFVFPTILSCIVVFPRDHYLYLQMVFMLLILISIFNYLFDGRSFKPIIFIVFGILLFLATPNINKYKFLKTSTNADQLCNKALIKHLKKNYAEKPHTLFTNLPFVSGMLPTTFKEVNTIFDKKKNIPFKHYLDSAKTDIIILLPSIFRDPHVKSDSTWIDFINNYEKYGFKKDNFSDCETYLLIKK